ncbi:MAG: leucyl/phenylalanyl-tRNA--protein transferase [Acidobacteria bacterium]|nr:leucyl/phenylalanyl-tRNA--protein transferase [Acidobacteriota bacterium]
MIYSRLFPGGPWLLGGAPRFPDPEATDENGLLAVGGDLSVPRLLAAYRAGIFPWFSKGEPILWWCPPVRSCLHPAEAHISRSLAKAMRQGVFELRMDTSFAQVVRACAKTPRVGQRGTWITAEMQAAYTTMHHRGWAHSIEAWREGRLVGGLYGIALGGAFFGESMFSLEPDASKACFALLAERLDAWGFTLLDCQVENPHTTSLGAKPLARIEFLARLAEALALEVQWGGAAGSEAPPPQ